VVEVATTIEEAEMVVTLTKVWLSNRQSDLNQSWHPLKELKQMRCRKNSKKRVL